MTARPLRDLGLAVGTLTSLPVPVRWPEGRSALQVAAWYPLVGAALGALLAGAVTVWQAYPLSMFAAPVLIVAFMGLVTRFLHWDGLADVADAWWVAPERRLDVLRDSRIGTFGGLALVVFVLVQVAALVEGGFVAASPVTLLVSVPMFGRLAATFAAWFGRPARRDGLGASVTGRPTAFAVLIAALPVIAVCALIVWRLTDPVAAALWCLLGIVAALAVPHLVSLRFGGVTGDVMGASVVIVETILLLGFDAYQHLG